MRRFVAAAAILLACAGAALADAAGAPGSQPASRAAAAADDAGPWPAVLKIALLVLLPLVWGLLVEHFFERFRHSRAGRRRAREKA